MTHDPILYLVSYPAVQSCVACQFTVFREFVTNTFADPGPPDRGAAHERDVLAAATVLGLRTRMVSCTLHSFVEVPVGIVIEPGDRVEAGAIGTPDYDRGVVLETGDFLARVAWDSGTSTYTPLSDLRLRKKGPSGRDRIA